jgi:hypothetical protein
MSGHYPDTDLPGDTGFHLTEVFVKTAALHLAKGLSRARMVLGILLARLDDHWHRHAVAHQSRPRHRPDNAVDLQSVKGLELLDARLCGFPEDPVFDQQWQAGLAPHVKSGAGVIADSKGIQGLLDVIDVGASVTSLDVNEHSAVGPGLSA